MDLIIKDDHIFHSWKGKLLDLVLIGKDLTKELECLSKYNVHAITVNRHFCKKRINSLDFLKDYPSIKGVSICNDDFDLNGLFYLKNLEDLIVKGKRSIDYSVFPHLKDLATALPGPYSFPDSIRSLSIRSLKTQSGDLTSIRLPEGLIELDLPLARIASLKGLPSRLKYISIVVSKSLRSLDGLQNSAGTLKKVWIENCPHLEDYSALYECHNIEHMLLVECRTIPSIGFVYQMNNLQHFAFTGTFVQDCDLNPLIGVPSVGFTNNKAYNHKEKDFIDRKKLFDEQSKNVTSSYDEYRQLHARIDELTK